MPSGNEERTIERDHFVPLSPIFKDGGIPEWHHNHSRKIYVDHLDMKCRILVLEASAVTVGIQLTLEPKGWLVEYEIKQSQLSSFKGTVWMTTGQLKSAFGLSDKYDVLFGKAVLADYGGTVAHQGKYLRYGDFLNIPGPGTGHDGDPNVSIDLSDEIKKAVAELVSGIKW
jgi:hypothetical protein